MSEENILQTPVHHNTECHDRDRHKSKLSEMHQVRKGESEVRAKTEEILKNFRAYRYAKTQYEKYKAIPQAGVASYNGMPNGSGAPELFFAQVGKMADMGNLTNDDHKDYEQYRAVVEAVEGALDTLNDEERSIIKLKWMDNLTLKQIAELKNMSLGTVKSKHRAGLSSLGICFRFIEPPQIEDIPRGAHTRFSHTNRIQSHMDIT